MFRPCCVVPSRNHAAALPGILERLKQSGLPIFLIDDASAEPARAALARMSDAADVALYRFEENQGKGGAVIKGFELAAAQSFTHVLQIDADGQHDAERIDEFLSVARAHPDALVTGAARFDGSVPASRKFGRYLTHFWVAIETLSFRVLDTMCGFRVYPLAPVMRLLQEEPIGRFMDFDTEIVVRLTWRGVPSLVLPVDVRYPAGNLSNFDVVKDNWRITKMHTRLVLAMILRLPSIVMQRPPSVGRQHHWAAMGERGLEVGLRLLGACYRWFGPALCRLLLLPIVAYFYATDKARRQASREFLGRALPRQPRWADGLRHQLDFAQKALDTVSAWCGDITKDRLLVEDRTGLDRAKADNHGALLIVSHLGNAELCRALLDEQDRRALTVLVHTQHARHYNRLLRRLQPGAADNLVEVSDIGPDTAILLQERVAQGGWIAIAGDRTALAPGNRSAVSFLGRPAPFSHGPYVLAHLLACPVYLLFCLREGRNFRLYFEEFAARVELPRKGREQAIEAFAQRYAARLETLACSAPFQWYNFFDFWAQ